MEQTTLLEYKCPCCGGAIAFDPKLQKLKCPYCDTEYETETLKDYDTERNSDTTEAMTWDMQAGGQWQDGEEESLSSFVCNSCGGEIIGDENTAATCCPYCGNPVAMIGRLSGVLKPDYVIPFQLDKEAAKSGLRNHFKGKVLLPSVFKDEHHLDEVKGIYVPFWLFNTDADAHIRYRATRLRHWSDSNFNYTETSHFAVIRKGSVGFERVPVDGSSKMADDLMESLEPYDFSRAVDFQTAYLAGYLADKYDVSAEDSVARANSRIKTGTEQAFASTVRGYATVVPEHSNVRLINGCAKYALYPVWILNTSWNGKKYTFAMNGQTGKFVGDLPMDGKKFGLWLAGLTGALTAMGILIQIAAFLL